MTGGLANIKVLCRIRIPYHTDNIPFAISETSLEVCYDPYIISSRLVRTLGLAME